MRCSRVEVESRSDWNPESNSGLHRTMAGAREVQAEASGD